MSIKKYYYLTKPGIIYGNSIAAAAGFFLASRGNIDFLLLVATLVGLAFIIASACVFNNYIDRDIDSKMERTKKRALVARKISGRNALIFASVLGLLGTFVLSFTNSLTIAVALFGVFFYVVMYGFYKRRSIHGTVVGSISGAVPPVVGYTAVTNTIDIAALILFLILVIWQMPHFYAIAIFRLNDYKAANIPVLPIVKGIKHTKIQILLYILALIIIAPLLTFFGYTGYSYMAVTVTFGLIWIGMGITGFKTQDDVLWAKKMFRFSLIILLLLCFMISVNSV